MLAFFSNRKGARYTDAWFVCNGNTFIECSKVPTFGDRGLFDDEVSDMGLDEVLMAGSLIDRYQIDNPEASFLLLHGIAPGQPFRVRVTFRFYQSYSYETGPELELETDVEILEVRPWSRDRVVHAWMRWISNGRPWFINTGEVDVFVLDEGLQVVHG